MTDNEFMEIDRIQKIQSVIRQYGENEFYVSWSGGKDSTVLSALIDIAIPNNRIPRVFMNTGIEYNAIVKFVKEKAETDNRVIIIKPQTNIKGALERDGYPFKSKLHSEILSRYQHKGMQKAVKNYINNPSERKTKYNCPDCLKYQFTPDFSLKVSDKCCDNMKETPLKNWQKQNNKPYHITAIMRSEGGRRGGANCLAFSGKKLKAFQPFAVVTEDFEQYLIDKYSIELCELYYPPYNFRRTGCKGCPFAIELQRQLDIMANFMPQEYRQCERIWAPVYAEYRRIGYRLRPVDKNQITFDEVMSNE